MTPIRAAKAFWVAEAYHQDYHLKNPSHYQRYRRGSGREAYLARVWGAAKKRAYPRPGDAELRKRLTPLQYKVTRKDATERPFRNRCWDHKAEGI